MKAILSKILKSKQKGYFQLITLLVLVLVCILALFYYFFQLHSPGEIGELINFDNFVDSFILSKFK